MNSKNKNRFDNIFNGLNLNDDGIWSSHLPSSSQEKEIQLREAIANTEIDDYLNTISKHHSIPVMDYEIERYQNFILDNGFILDVGGCWGWHWRKINLKRPDVSIVIVDFVRSNLLHAKEMLGDLINNQVHLVHADATKLPFPENSFDGIWSVQTFQHIPNYTDAFQESFRVLKNGGRFLNYSLNSTPLVKLIYKMLGRKYHIEGEVKDSYYLIRACDSQRKELEKIFSSKVENRYCECFFCPELKLTYSGKVDSWLGKIDSYIGKCTFVSKFFARQCGFETIKNKY